MHQVSCRHFLLRHLKFLYEILFLGSFWLGNIKFTDFFSSLLFYFFFNNFTRLFLLRILYNSLFNFFLFWLFVGLFSKPVFNTVEYSIQKLTDIDYKVNSLTGNFVLSWDIFVNIVWNTFEKFLHMLIIFPKIVYLLDDSNHFVDIHVFEFIIFQAFIFELVVHFFLYKTAICLCMDQHVCFHLLSHELMG